VAAHERSDFRFVQLREVSGETVVEETHVLDAACSSEFL
jgi:hypothetical protein